MIDQLGQPIVLQVQRLKSQCSLNVFGQLSDGRFGILLILLRVVGHPDRLTDAQQRGSPQKLPLFEVDSRRDNHQAQPEIVALLGSERDPRNALAQLSNLQPRRIATLRKHTHQPTGLQQPEDVLEHRLIARGMVPDFSTPVDGNGPHHPKQFRHRRETKQP